MSRETYEEAKEKLQWETGERIRVLKYQIEQNEENLRKQLIELMPVHGVENLVVKLLQAGNSVYEVWLTNSVDFRVNGISVDNQEDLCAAINEGLYLNLIERINNQAPFGEYRLVNHEPTERD